MSFDAKHTSPKALVAQIDAHILASSANQAWKDAYVEILDQAHVQQPVLIPAVAEPMLSWTISGEAVVEERELGGSWTSHAVRAGDFYLTHSHAPYELRWVANEKAPFQSMHLYLALPLLQRAIEAVSGKPADDIRLQEVSAARDPVITSLLGLLHREVLQHAGGSALLVEGVLQSLAVHLARHYTCDEAGWRGAPGLAGAKLRRALAFMADRLGQPFDLAALAREAGLSAFHFSRLFKQAMGVSPSRYFIRQRMMKAQQLLRETSLSVIDIGMAVGYANPSHFGQVFRRESGVSPSQYRGR